MKSLLLLVSLCLSVPAFGADDPPRSGRFQIVSFPARAIRAEGIGWKVQTDEDRPVLLKLDTATGETWYWVDFLIDGNQVRGWVPALVTADPLVKKGEPKRDR